MDRKVDFLIAGVQKGGTTALDRMLREHPRIQMAQKKETHFFDNEDIDWSDPPYSRYHQYYDWSSLGCVRGEATPIYTYWPDCLDRIQRYRPGIKFIVIFRHPSFRAFSHWRMETTRSAESLMFSEAIRGARMRATRAHRVYSYVERGYYAQQVARLLSLFPRENILFLKTDEMWRNTQSVLDRITSFLGVPPIVGIKRVYTVPLRSADLGEMPPGDRAYLDELFRDELVRMSALTGLDVSHWLSRDYHDPMQSEMLLWETS
jgi:hypothetical protein